MPIYEYACDKCGHHLEARQGFSDAPLTTCPSCSEEALQRLISESSFALKGSGWYADGYSAAEAAKAKSAAASSANGTATSDTKADKADKTEKTEKATPAPKADAAKPAAASKTSSD